MTITDTTFFASETNYTIHVDLMELDQVTVTSTSITFINTTSVGTNLTNSNATFDAVAEFIGLFNTRTLRNINSSTDLFTSSLGSQNFNATFSSGQVIRITAAPEPSSTSTDSICSDITGGFGSFFGFFPVIFTIVAIITLVLFLIMILVLVHKNRDNDEMAMNFFSNDLVTIFLGLGILGLIGLILLIMFGFLCTI